MPSEKSMARILLHNSFKTRFLFKHFFDIWGKHVLRVFFDHLRKNHSYVPDSGVFPPNLFTTTSLDVECKIMDYDNNDTSSNVGVHGRQHCPRVCFYRACAVGRAFVVPPAGGWLCGPMTARWPGTVAKTPQKNPYELHCHNTRAVVAPCSKSNISPNTDGCNHVRITARRGHRLIKRFVANHWLTRIRQKNVLSFILLFSISILEWTGIFLPTCCY